MTKDQFKDIFKRIEAAWGQEYTDLQFEEWLDSFEKEEYNIALRAYRLMKGEYVYPPVIATFQAYIQRIKEYDEAVAESNKPQDDTPIMSSENRQRWLRYYVWCAHKKCWPKPGENAIKLKEQFEKEHPDWEPPGRVKTKKRMDRIGNILNEGEFLP